MSMLELARMDKRLEKIGEELERIGDILDVVLQNMLKEVNLEEWIDE